MARTPNSRTPTPSGQTQADTHLGGSLDPPSPPRASQKSHPFSALPYHGLPQALCTHFLRMSSHITAEQGGRVEFAAAQRPPPSWKDRPLTPPPKVLAQAPQPHLRRPPLCLSSAGPQVWVQCPSAAQLRALRPGVQPPCAAPGQTTGPRPWPPTCCYPGPWVVPGGGPGRPVPLGRAVQPYQQGPRRARTPARQRRPPARLGAAAAWWARAP